MTLLWTALAVFAAGAVKGVAGLGFPTLATPLLTLTVDVKTAVVLLILPNIVMDGIQFSRRGAPTKTIRRLVPVLIGGAVGTVLGTRLLIVLPTRAVLLLLGGFTFLVYKLVQLATVAWYRLLTSALAATSIALTGVALAGFVVGLWIQNRLDQRAFNRAVLALLGALGLWLVARSVLI
jgi:uncharacterized membrane protein YfcA